MSTIDIAGIKVNTNPSPDVLATMWRNQWRDVPAALCLQIESATDINPAVPPVFESIGLTGAYEATRTMVYADYALGMSRAAYEGNQGCEDFGWNRLIQNWASPGIYVASDGEPNLTRYDGSHSLVHSKVVAWVNSGTLDLKSILNLDSDDSGFVKTDENPDRKGGFGQGAKVMLTTFVANKTDRINALELYLEKHDSTLTQNQVEAIHVAIDKLKISLEVEGESDTFATVQSKGSDGIYRRTYCYRVPFQSGGKELWKLRYIVVELDEDKIPQAEKDKVIFAVHYPDIPLAESLNGMRENMLETDPYYPDKHSLVRNPDSTQPAATISTTTCKLSAERSYERDTPSGVCVVERIDRSIYQPDSPAMSGKIYFRGTHMIPEENSEIRLIFDYNIKKLDQRASARIARSSNSSYVSGPITEIVADSVSQISLASDWVRIIDLAQEVTTADYSTRFFPELSPRSIKDTKNNQPVYDALTNAFDLRYPQAHRKVARSQKDLDAYREFTGDMSPIPIISSSKLVDFMSEAGLVDIKAKNDEMIEQKLLVKHKTGNAEIVSLEHVANLIRNSSEYQEIMKSGQLDVERFIKLAFIDNDIFDFSRSPKSYSIDAPQGKHALVFQMRAGYGIDNIIGDLIAINNSENRDPMGLAILLAAIDSGIDIRFASRSGSQNATITKIEITSSGNLVIFSGESLRGDSDWYFGTIEIAGKAIDLLKIQNNLDATIGATHPDIISARDENEFSKTLQVINRTLSTLAPGETVSEATLENIAQVLQAAQDAQAKINASLDKLQGTRRRVASNNGAINGALQTGVLPGGSRVEGIYREGSMFARTSQSSHSILSRNREAISARRESGESEGFGGNDMKCVLYGKVHHNDVYPVEAYEKLQYIPGGMRRSNEYNKLEIAEDPENGPWRYYYPSEGSGYISRVTDDQTHYDGFLEFRRQLLPTSYEAVLPVDVNKYEITYIQYPVEAGQEPQIPPLLMFDPINRQYSLQFSNEDTPDVLKILPAGTRIYFRTRSEDELKTQPPVEKFLMDNHPTYYKSLTESLIIKDKLDPEARKFIDFLEARRPPLTRRETMTAVYRFWEKRRLYDDEGVVCDTIEELITLGIGVCDEAEPPMTQIPRLLGVPTRARVAYFDQEHQGNLSPPFHMVTEFLNDNGQWEVWRPPGSRVTSQYAQKLASQAASGVVPHVFDAGGLGVGGGEYAKLPKDVQQAVDKVAVNHGDNISQGAVAILNAKNRGEKTNAAELVEELVREQQPTADSKFQTDTEQIGRVLELMQESNRHIEKLQKKYGVGSKQVEAYRQKVADRLAKMLVNSVKVK